jgi:hypothetical protein
MGYSASKKEAKKGKTIMVEQKQSQKFCLLKGYFCEKVRVQIVMGGEKHWFEYLW